MNEQTQLLLTTGIGLAVLLALLLIMQRWAGVKLRFEPLVAALRAIAQLTVLAMVFQLAFEHAWMSAIVLAVMMTVAALTSASRLKEIPLGRRAGMAGVYTGAIITVGLIFALRMMDVSVSNIIAMGGIITGNSMSAATLTGRRFRDASRYNRGEVEGWLALGAQPKQAFARVSKVSMQEMLIPTVDSTKNTGLVTLPGAFVGALIGGASPVEAARFQLVVLVGIMFAQTVVGIVVTQILSRATMIVADEQEAVADQTDTAKKLVKDEAARADAHRAEAESKAAKEKAAAEEAAAQEKKN